MLPMILTCYEIWFGQRRWKPLAPFFLASLCFGIQSILLNPNHDNEEAAPVKNVTNEEAITGRSDDENEFEDADDIDEDDVDDLDADEAGVEE